MTSGDDGRVRPGVLISLLAQSLGYEKGEQAVLHALEELHLKGEDVSSDEARAVLDRLAEDAGIIGVAARTVRSRGHFARPAGKAHATSTGLAPVSIRGAQRAGLPRKELSTLLAHSLGVEMSDSLVLETAHKLGLPGASFTRDQALAVLAELEQQPGVVGVTARFARARAILRFPE